MTLPVHWVESLAGVAPATWSRSRATRRTTRSPYAGCARASGSCSPTAPVRRSRAPCATTGKRRLTVVGRRRRCTCPSRSRGVTVVQALPKGDRGELAVEVLTEVGVATIVPWAAARSVAVWRGERAEKSLARWRATAREAAKQSRRRVVPRRRAAGVDRRGRRLVGAGRPGARAPRGGRRRRWPRWPCPRTGSVVVVVGPEGGLTDDEVAAFTAAGAHAVRLGAEVLRTSTAGVVAAVAALPGADRPLGYLTSIVRVSTSGCPDPSRCRSARPGCTRRAGPWTGRTSTRPGVEPVQPHARRRPAAGRYFLPSRSR